MGIYQMPLAKLLLVWVLIGIALAWGYDSQSGFSYSSLLTATFFGAYSLRELLRDIRRAREEQKFKEKMKKNFRTSETF